jgi:hypothetical protein
MRSERERERVSRHEWWIDVLHQDISNGRLWLDPALEIDRVCILQGANAKQPSTDICCCYSSRDVVEKALCM